MTKFESRDNFSIDHYPVMIEEIKKHLINDTKGVYVDGTFGLGGHSEGLINVLNKNGTLFVFDLDLKMYEFYFSPLKEKYQDFKNFFFINDNFINFDIYLKKHNFNNVDGFLLDLGISTFQLLNENRGFSYNSNEKLDMRININEKNTSAYDIINNFSSEQLSQIFLDYGEEYNYKKIVKKIINSRKFKKIYSCKELSDIVSSCFPPKRNRKHPATKVFQALRIAINDELYNLSTFLDKSFEWLKRRGSCIAIISYHSLEDRIVKKKFKEKEKSGFFETLTKKPIIPISKEIFLNKRSRGAKLRIIRKK